MLKEPCLHLVNPYIRVIYNRGAATEERCKVVWQCGIVWHCRERGALCNVGVIVSSLFIRRKAFGFRSLFLSCSCLKCFAACVIVKIR